MHGILKVRTTEEQRLLKLKEQEKKLKTYQSVLSQILINRKQNLYEEKDLVLSAHILNSNPDVYTLWNFRKEAIKLKVKESQSDEGKTEENLIEDLENELRLTEQCLIANPKSYSVWHHRYWLLEIHPQPKWHREFDLCTKYLQKDDRNFHVWDYRRLILKKIGLDLEKELQFSTERINEDFSNYSSWHYRSTLQVLDEENIDAEITLVQNAVFTDPSDSSAWFYLRWVLSHSHLISKERYEQLKQAFDELAELEPKCKWILLAKCWLLENNGEKVNINIYEKLKEVDPLRAGFYDYCINK